jgi:hypothetical protein
MKREDKQKIASHYFWNACACGANKRRCRWVCLDCKAKLSGTFAERWLEFCCGLHMKAAARYLKKAERNKYGK